MTARLPALRVILAPDGRRQDAPAHGVFPAGPGAGVLAALLRRQRVEGREDAVGAGVHADGGEIAPAHDPLRVDHDQRALREAVLVAIGAVAPRDVALRLEVGEEREMKLPRLANARWHQRAIHGNAEELRAVFLELRRHLVV